MYALVERCGRGEEDAWTELWDIYHKVAAKPVADLVLGWRMDSTEAEDITADFFVYLHEDAQKRLRAFRGSTEPTFHRWLVKVACSFARNWLAKRRRAIRKAPKVVDKIDPEDRTGPTEAEVMALLRDLEDVMPGADVERLRILVCLTREPPATQGCPRTIRTAIAASTERHWKKRLKDKYRRHL